MISVVICSHNPNENYFRRVLAALRAQTLPTKDWELLVIDNASKTRLEFSWDLSWHRNARHVREEKIGLTQARLCGIRESAGELVVFVDDDNVLSEDYLSVAVEISRAYRQIGAFGASTKGEFEEPPPAWMERYLWALAIRELKRDYWSNILAGSDAVPFGAGLCVRRVVAEDYERKSRANPMRTSLGRTGAGMGSCEDIDLAWCAIDLGMGTGSFRALQLTHLIPSRRLTKDYIASVVAGLAASDEIMASFRPGEGPKPNAPEFLRFAWQMLRGSAFDRRMLLESRRERKRAREFLAGKRKSIEL